MPGNGVQTMESPIQASSESAASPIGWRSAARIAPSPSLEIVMKIAASSTQAPIGSSTKSARRETTLSSGAPTMRIAMPDQPSSRAASLAGSNAGRGHRTTLGSCGMAALCGTASAFGSIGACFGLIVTIARTPSRLCGAAPQPQPRERFAGRAGPPAP